MPRRRVELYLVGSLILIAIWAAISQFYPPVILPSPIETLRALMGLIESGALFRQMGITLGRIALAFGISAMVGGTAAVLANLKPSAYPLLKPAVDLALSAPPISWLVLALVWFGTGSVTPIFTVVVVAAPVVFANVYEGMRSVDGELIAMASVYGARGRTLLQDLYLPALTPHLFAGLRVAAALAVRVGVMGELLASDSGVGNALALARTYLETPQVFAWVGVTVGLLILLESLVLTPLQRWGERWRWQT